MDAYLDAAPSNVAKEAKWKRYHGIKVGKDPAWYGPWQYGPSTVGTMGCVWGRYQRGGDGMYKVWRCYDEPLLPLE